jgi:hypothetical protein
VRHIPFEATKAEVMESIKDMGELAASFDETAPNISKTLRVAISRNEDFLRLLGRGGSVDPKSWAGKRISEALLDARKWMVEARDLMGEYMKEHPETK